MSHGHLLDCADFYRAAGFEYRAALGDFRGVREIIGLNQHVSRHDILRLGVRAVVDGLLFAPDDLTRVLQPGSLISPFAPRSLNQLTHVCKCCCISSGEPDVFLPRNK